MQNGKANDTKTFTELSITNTESPKLSKRIDTVSHKSWKGDYFDYDIQVAEDDDYDTEVSEDDNYDY